MNNIINLIKSFFTKKRKPQEKTIPLVVALNGVDKIIADGWNNRLNLPTKEAEIQIERRSSDIIEKLATDSSISKESIEYYSAKKRYRLTNLLNRLITNASNSKGWKLEINPADPFAIADPEVQAFVAQERSKEQAEEKRSVNPDIFKNLIGEEDWDKFIAIFKKEIETPVRIAVVGKSGVGKSTTINNLFNVEFKTSDTTVGTIESQTLETKLDNGVLLTVIDLPGYGRSLAEDEEYYKIYEQILPTCDLILLVIQANTRDFADDIEFIQKAKEWF